MFDFKDDEHIDKLKLMKGGAYLLSSLKDGTSAKESWDKLHEMGLSDKECELCSSAVRKFLRHSNGKHDQCGSGCVDGKLDMSDRQDAVKLIRAFELNCIKCGTDKISGEKSDEAQLKAWGKKCPDCEYPIHDSLMNAIERHFRGKLPDDEVEMFKVGFEWARIK